MTKPVRPPTLRDVAQLAGVSVPTASRALNGGIRGAKSGSPDMVKRVADAARALGYSVSPAAQAIKDGRSRSVALVVSDVNDFGAAAIVAGVMTAADRRGVAVSVRATNDRRSRETEILRELSGERHRAIIIATTRTTDASRERAFSAGLRLLNEHGAPVVMIGHSTFGFPTVTVDNQKGAEALATGLVASGARSFAVVAGPDDEVTSSERLAGFLDGLAAGGISVADVRVARADFSRDGGVRAVQTLDWHAECVEVIAAMSDAMAVGAIAALRAAGTRVPEEVEVTGFDHVPILSDVMPHFSTVEVPLGAFGEAALSLAFDDAPASGETISLLPTPIIHGERMPLRQF